MNPIYLTVLSEVYFKMINENSKKSGYDDSMSVNVTKRLVADTVNSRLQIEKEKMQNQEPQRDIQINSNIQNDQPIKRNSSNTVLIGTDNVKRTIQTEAPAGKRQEFVKGFDEDELEDPVPSFGARQSTVSSKPALVTSVGTVQRQPSERQTYQTISFKDETGFENTNPKLSKISDSEIYKQKKPPFFANKNVTPQNKANQMDPNNEHLKRTITLDPIERQRRREALKNGTSYAPPSSVPKERPVAVQPIKYDQVQQVNPVPVQVEQPQIVQSPKLVTPTRQEQHRQTLKPVPIAGQVQQKGQETSDMKAKDPFTRQRESRFFIFKVASLAVFSVTVVILAFLVWQINSLQSQLEEAQSAVTETSDTEENALALATAQAEIRALEDHIIILEAQLFGPPPVYSGDLDFYDFDGFDDGFDNVDIDQNIGTPLQGEQQIHIVQSGDSLGVIAMNLLGSQFYADLIMEANNMTNPNITIGQELIIPAVPTGTTN